ncbi:OmpA family protein [Aliivibrio sifiae]|uniref:OmpA family protein n=1 Tax=Aliivibrio sifiae TaxID=566293 RepID=UPI003D0F8271
MKKQLSQLSFLIFFVTNSVVAGSAMVEKNSTVISIDDDDSAYLTDVDEDWDIIRDSHLFLGIKGGWQIDSDNTYEHNTLDDYQWGVFGGFQFTPEWSWDVGYQSLGSVNADFSGVDVDTTIWETAVRYDWYVMHDTSIYGRAGMTVWDMKKSTSSTDINEIGYSPLIEVGVNYRLTSNLYLNAGYRYINEIGHGDGTNDTIGEYDNHAWSLGLAYHFGSAPKKQSASVIRTRTVTKKVVFNGHSLFALNSSSLQPSHDLKKLADSIIVNKEGEVYIVGYTDSTGSEAYNQKLSEKRAQVVAHYLIEKGVEPSRIQVTGQGENNPIADNTTEIGRAKNRRANVTFNYSEDKDIIEKVINP